MADRDGEFNVFSGNHVRIDIRIDIFHLIKPTTIQKFGKQIHLVDLTQTRLIWQVLALSLSQGHVANLRNYISTSKLPLATNIGRMVTYLIHSSL